ncbi:DUF2076 domain-containing protein [Aquabacter spiritensis]|uniref:DUF2076 family protein n=1 Tax=Aquabacter spiritensis TaxID=933073 RepID=A0A4R3M654_9HYPH|nr:DUF2076 domain-containing protein [Aquabacter spiritensis]TCT06735.1 hypothetical protein EDC64_102214 [Aquabacter spiritensis]
MTPEERALIDGLFDRMRGAASQPRDADAEALIARRVAEMPFAPYALSQTVLVQEHALKQAAARIEELEDQARQQAAPQPQSGGFLGGLFGGGRGTSVPTSGSRGTGMALPAQSGQQGYGQQGYGQQPNYPQGAPGASPWGGQQRSGGFGGGGFLQGAMATAAGVAGGMLLADGIRNLMSGGEGPVAQAAAAELPAVETPVADTGDLGSQAQDALGGGADQWGAAPQDASFDDGDSGWDSGGDDSSWA